MKYFIKQQYVSMKDKYAVKDEAGNDIYFVSGQIISFGKKIRLYDMQNNEIYFLDQKPFTLFGKIEIKVGDDVVGTIRGKFSLWGKVFEVEIPNNNLKFKVRSFVGYTFKVTDMNSDSKEPVATISKKLLKIADTYCVETLDESVPPDLAIIMGLGVDIFCHGDKH